MNIVSILYVEIKKNFWSIVKISMLYVLLFLLFLSIFDPDMFGDLGSALDNYPQAILDMIGGTIALDTLAGFLTMEFLSMIWFWVGIYITMKAAQDIPTAIDNKSIDIIISKPIKRWEYILGKHIRYILTLFIIFLSMIGIIALMLPILPNLAEETVDWPEYILSFFWAFLFCVSLECTAFLLSTFLSRKKAVSTAIAVVVVFFFMGTFYTYFEDSIMEEGKRVLEGDEWLPKYFSLFYYYDPSLIMIEHVEDYYLTSFNFDNLGVYSDMIVLVVYSVVSTIISVIIFNRRDIPV